MSLCRRELQAVRDVPGSPAEPGAALVVRADSLRDAGDTAAAEVLLACAAVEPGVAGNSRAQYEILRRQGILDYHMARPVEALARFECALHLAETLEDQAATAKQLKNKGASLRRIGDYAGAMDVLTRSLAIQRELGDGQVGPVLNNIADVYREMEQREEAERVYRQALDAFRASGDTVQAMHVYDSLSELALDRRDAQGAIALLRRALEELRVSADDSRDDAGAHRYQLMIQAGLIRAFLAQGDTASARTHAADARALAEAHGLPLPPELQLQIARMQRLDGQREAAAVRLRRAADAAVDVPVKRSELLRELSQTLAESGREGQALEALRAAHALDVQDLRAQRDRGLAWSNARFNLAESRLELAEAEAHGQRRTLQLWLTAVSALAALAMLALASQRRFLRAREVEAVRQARYKEALARYRREYEALAEDRHLLQALLDTRDDALVLADGDGLVLSVNRAACDLLSIECERIVGSALGDHFVASSAAALRDALERMEDAGDLRLRLQPAGDLAPLQADLRQWEQGDGRIVLTLHAVADAAAAQLPADAPVQAQPAVQGDVRVGPIEPDDARSGASGTAGDEEGPRAGQAALDRDAPETAPAGATDDVRHEAFRRDLVELMLAVVEAWERDTGHNRIELAERSRIWRINIDDGRLRARAMERYLNLSKLPRNPRWRDVLRSAYYVLSNCATLVPETRDDLQRRVDRLLAMTRREALM